MKCILNALVKGKLKGKQWLDSEKRVKEFMAGNNLELEKNEIGKYTEMLYMACRAVENIEKEDDYVDNFKVAYNIFIV